MGSTKLPAEKCTLVPDQNGKNKPWEVMSGLKSMSAGVGACGWFTIPGAEGEIWASKRLFPEPRGTL